jgi:vancomycin resistance protein YoaR
VNKQKRVPVEPEFDTQPRPPITLPEYAGYYGADPYAPDDAADMPFNPWIVRLPILAVVGAVLWALLMTLALAAYQRYIEDKIVPGAQIMGVSVGGMTPAQALAAVEDRFSYDQEAVFTFREPGTDRFWQLSARDLGVTLDAEATIEAAYQLGHSGSVISDVVQQGLIWLNGLNEIAAQIDRPPQDARLIFDGTNVQTTPGQIGRVVDVRATLAQLDAAIMRLANGGEIALVISETQPIAFDAESAAAKARAAISAPVMLVADDGQGNALGPWFAQPAQIAALLTVAAITVEDGTQRYDVSVNVAPFRAYIESLGAGLLVPARDGRFHYDESSGQLIMIQSAVNGRTLNVDETLRRMEEAIFSPSNRTVLLAFDYQLPRYHNNVTAGELGITELIAQGNSSYAGSPRARIDNIILAASRFDGIIIAPGEQFSFNAWLGDVTPEAGYVSGRIIYGGRTIDGVGGGVCQVSTTAFRAAFYAGFPFVERHAHGYRVGYYERGDPEGVGMDAAIYTGELDMRFINDTPYHLLIETSVYPATSTVQFRFYSTNPGRQVVKQGPVVQDVQAPLPTRYEVNSELLPGQELWVDWAAEGAYVEVTRIILDTAGNEIRRERIASQYQPWGAIVQVAPGDGRASTT